MEKPRIQVDFNELVQPDVVLLSKTDLVIDATSACVLLSEGLPVFVYEYNCYADGTEEYLLAEGNAELNDVAANGEWSKPAKWCCRINDNGVRVEIT